MKIRSQDGRGVFEFGNACILQKGARNEIWGGGSGEPHLYFLGRYENEARAKGVLLDIESAYCKGKRVFYMPVE